MSRNPTLAYMGYAYMCQRTCKVVVKICAYCPDKRTADRDAVEAGQLVTHSICRVCYKNELGKILEQENKTYDNSNQKRNSPCIDGPGCR